MPRIPGVLVRDLVVHPDDRGRLFEVLRNDDPHFRKFGQAYITTTYPGVVKAWHRHRLQEDCFCVLKGMVKLAIHDDRAESPTCGVTDEVWFGEHRLRLVVIPAGLWHGWTCVSETEAMILNLVTEPYNHETPDEERVAPHGVLPYDWARRDG